MIEVIEYSQKSFSKIDFNPKYIRDFKFDYPSKSRLALRLFPMVAMTCKKTPYLRPSAFSMNSMDKERELYLMNEILKLDREVTLTMCTNFYLNGFYTSGLDKMIKDCAEYYGVTEEDIAKEYCKEYGINLNEFMRNLGPHMIIIDKSIWNASTLAHEFGHYLNTIGKGEVKGHKAHQNLMTARDRFNKSWYLGIILNLSTFVAGGFTKFKLAAILQGLSSLNSAARILITKPIIDAEYYATYTGLKLLKEIGSTEDELKLFKEDLYGPYALDSYKRHYRRDQIKNSLIHAGIATGSYLLDKSNKQNK